METAFAAGPRVCACRSEGYDVIIVDNLSRRKIDVELGCQSLTPIQPIETRLRAWEAVSGRKIEYYNLDVAREYTELEQLIRRVEPKAVVHFAEQRAAPYSMKSPRHKRYTVDNNINTTHNILCAIVESGLDVHMVHLGTMGVYGYGTAGMAVPEGYLPVKVDTPRRREGYRDPLSAQSRQHLSHDQDARCAAVLLLQQE